MLAVATLCGYAAAPALWPVAALAVLLALAGAAFFVSSRRRMALHVDETGFRLIGALREQPVTPWRDVTEFRIISVAGNRYIGYQFSALSSRNKVPGGVMLPIARFADLPLDAVAGKTRVMEDEFIDAKGTDITDAFRLYLRPLLGSGMPDAFRLRAGPVARILDRAG